MANPRPSHASKPKPNVGGVAAPSSVASPSPSSTSSPQPPKDNSNMYGFAQSAALTQVGGVIGLLFCFYGYRLTKLVVFIAGFCFLASTFYLFSPGIFKYEFCCTTHSKSWTRIVFSLVLGVIGGFIALKVLRIGIFLVGAIFGIISAFLVLQTPLAEASFMENDYAFGLFYAGCSLLFAILALVFEKPAIVLATSVGGSFAVFLAIDYWVNSAFSDVVVYFIDRFQNSIENSVSDNAPPAMVKFDRSFSDDAYGILAGWAALAFLGCVVQYKVTGRNYTHRQQVVTKELPVSSQNVIILKDPVAGTSHI